METRSRKQQRLQSIQSWQDLEPGVWEKVFRSLHGDDIRKVRLVSRTFSAAACRTIKQLDIGYAYTPQTGKLGKKQSCVNLTAKEVKQLPCSFAAIQSVSISTSEGLHPEVVARLNCFPQLKSLRALFGGIAVSRKILHAICGLSTVRFLHMEECNFKDSSVLEELQTMPHLCALQINKSHPHDPHMMAAIAKLTGLTALDISRPFCFKDVGYAALSSLSNLQYLHIGCSWKLGAGESIAFLSELRALKHLAISRCFISEQDLAPLSRLTNLVQLLIHDCHNIQALAFRDLSALQKLERLSLDNSNMLTDKSVQSLCAALPGLQRLHLGASVRISAAASIACLQTLTRLRELTVPQHIFRAWPDSAARQSLPHLRTYQAALSREVRVPGGLEERFRVLVESPAVMNELGMSSRMKLLQWFHGGFR